MLSYGMAQQPYLYIYRAFDGPMDFNQFWKDLIT